MHNSFNVFLQKLKQLSQFYSSLAVQIPVGKKKKKKSFPLFPSLKELK